MTNQTPILEAFVKLGDFFREFCEFTNNKAKNIKTNNKWLLDFDQKIELAKQKNSWFIRENIVFSLQVWGELLTKENLEKWLGRYNFQQNKSKTVALIMAGNIPLVGFHDFLCTLVTDNSVLIKLSANDNVLLPFIANYLILKEPLLRDRIVFKEEKLDPFDVVIATGSNNTSRYFEHYFGKKPNIIRKSRNSVAVLTGNETREQLEALGEDIFRYYGLGCRSVSKVFVPENYDFDLFYNSIYNYNPIINQIKYANNYDYNKAVFLMSAFKILDNGFLMLKEDEGYASPIATVFFEKYASLEALKSRLRKDKDRIQCIVGEGVLEEEIAFGQTQYPSLTDYADGIDTVEFLLKTS